MNTKNIYSLIMILFVAIVVVAIGPPQHYEALQESSDSYLDIEVISVDYDTLESGYDLFIIAKAVVEKVNWDKSGTAVGDTIIINYDYAIYLRPTGYLIDENGDSVQVMLNFSGLGQAPIISLGEKLPAFLDIDSSGVFKPSALIASFSPRISITSVIMINDNLKIKSFITQSDNYIKLDFTSIKQSEILINIFNIQGKIIMSQNLSGGCIHKIDIGGFSTQTLFLQTNIADVREQVKIAPVKK